jgi:hypothetical protein
MSIFLLAGLLIDMTDTENRNISGVRFFYPSFLLNGILMVIMKAFLLKGTRCRPVYMAFIVVLLGACNTDSDSDNKTGANTSDPTVSISANPTSVTSGSASTLTWSSTNATACTASGAWSGSKSLSGSASTGTLTNASNTFTLTCDGSGGSANQSVVVTTTPVTPTAPTVSLSANPTSVTRGDSTVLTWSSTDATSCTASGAWSGSKSLSGSASTGNLTSASNTFTLTCNGDGGSASQSATVTVSDPNVIYGLDFQGSASTSGTVRFKFTNPLDAYPATYIWRAYPKQQSSYYTAFFWGNDDGKGTLDTFLWTSNGGADMYYGAHPYPKSPPNGSTHNWEISVEQNDFQNGSVVYDRWYTQALVVWADSNGYKHHIFYWDLPNTDSAHRVERVSDPDWGNRTPPSPALTWGDAPWAPSEEMWYGMLRGIQVYSTNLSLANILNEANTPLSTPAGAANIWYLKTNPTPSDISDTSGAGNNPVWVGSERPLLWEGP